jgi:hypothetical protein
VKPKSFLKQNEGKVLQVREVNGLLARKRVIRREQYHQWLVRDLLPFKLVHLLTVDWVVNTTLAAWEKPPWRTTSTKVRRVRKSIGFYIRIFISRKIHFSHALLRPRMPYGNAQLDYLFTSSA